MVAELVFSSRSKNSGVPALFAQMNKMLAPSTDGSSERNRLKFVKLCLMAGVFVHLLNAVPIPEDQVKSQQNFLIIKGKQNHFRSIDGE